MAGSWKFQTILYRVFFYVVHIEEVHLQVCKGLMMVRFDKHPSIDEESATQHCWPGRQNNCSGGDQSLTLSGVSQCQRLNRHLQNWLSLCLHHRLPRTKLMILTCRSVCLLLQMFQRHSFRVPQHGGTKGNLSRGLHLCTASTKYTAARNVANQTRLLQVTQSTGAGLCSLHIWGKQQHQH